MQEAISIHTLDWLAPVNRVEQKQELEHIQKCENQALDDLINEAKKWGNK